MDVFLKYAMALVAAKNDLTAIEDITDEMIDKEIDYSLNKVYFHTDDDAKICDVGRFRFVAKEKLPELFTNYGKQKENIKTAVHIPIPDMDKKKFMETITNGYNKLFNPKEKLTEGNFILFNSQSYVSKNNTNGYTLPVRERKLYFLAYITPYKAAYINKESDGQNKYAIYVDLEFSLLVEYIKIFIEHWHEFNQDILNVNVNKSNKSFYSPQKINYDVNRKYFMGMEAPLLKFQVLKFLTQIRITAKQDDQERLFKKLANATLYEVNVNKKKVELFNLNQYLIKFAVDDKISDFIEVVFNSFYHTYKKIKNENPKAYEKYMSSVVYGVLNVFKSPANKNNINYINQFRLTYTNNNVNYNNYIEIMETILKLNNSEELINVVKTVGDSIKTAIWSSVHQWGTENKKSLEERFERYDDVRKDMQFTISAMQNLTAFLNLSTNISRRLGRTVSTEELFNLLVKNPQTLVDVKNLLNFYLSQPYKKKPEIVKDKTETKESFDILD